MLHAYIQPMPPTARYAFRRVADEVAHAELLENSGERRREILRGFDREEPPTRDLAQVAKKAHAMVANFDAVHDHIAAASGFDDGLRSQPAGGVHAVAEDDQK